MSFLFGLAGTFLFKGAWKFAGRAAHIGLSKCFEDQKVAAIETTIDSLIKHVVAALFNLAVVLLGFMAKLGKNMCGQFWDVLRDSWTDPDSVQSSQIGLSDSDSETAPDAAAATTTPKSAARHRTRTVLPPQTTAPNSTGATPVKYGFLLIAYVGLSFLVFFAARYHERSILVQEKTRVYDECMITHGRDETRCAAPRVAKMEMAKTSSVYYAISHAAYDMLGGGLIPILTWTYNILSALFLSTDSGDYLLLLAVLLPTTFVAAVSMFAVWKHMSKPVYKAKKLS